MNELVAIDIAKDFFFLVIKVSAPMLIASLVIGLTISILQTVTSIQEQTLTFVPKLVTIVLVLMLCGNWIMNEIVEFMNRLLTNLSYYINVT